MKLSHLTLKSLFLSLSLSLSLSILTFFVISTATAHAATYYIDAEDGNDSNSGLSEALAWQSIAKVSAFTFSAGDNILFKRNQTHIGQLSLQNETGTALNPITVGAYDTGDRPVLNGAFSLSGVNNFIVENLVVSNEGATAVTLSDVSDTSIRNLKIQDNPLIGIFIGHNSKKTGKNVNIENVEIVGVQLKGITLKNVESVYLSNLDIYLGTFILQKQAIFIEGELTEKVDIRNSNFSRSSIDTEASTYGVRVNGDIGDGVWLIIKDTSFTNLQFGVYSFVNMFSNPDAKIKIDFEKLIFKNIRNGLDLYVAEGAIKNSLFEDFLYTGTFINGNFSDLNISRNIFNSDGYHDAVRVILSSSTIAHNTFINASNTKTAIYANATTSIYNNIISGFAVGINSPNSTNIKNNLISAPTPTTGFTPDPSNLITSNPRLHPDYSPKDNSPAIDSALPLPSYTHDFFHKPLYKLPDIGAIEWHPLYQITNPASTQVSQEVYTEISLTLPTTTVKMSPSILGLTGGSSYGYSGNFYIKTNHKTGYQATLNFSTTTAMQRVGGGGHINNYLPLNPAVPDAEFRNSTSSHWFGYRVGSDSSKTYLSPLFKTNFFATACNAGTDVYIGRCWYNQVDATIPLTIMSRNSKTSVIGDDFHLQFQINVAKNPTPAIPEGMYQATATVTVLPN